MDIHEKKIKLDNEHLLSMLGFNDQYLQLIENKFQTTITVRGSTLILKGDPEEIKSIELIFQEMTHMLNRRNAISKDDVEAIIQLIDVSKVDKEKKSIDSQSIIYSGIRDVIRARNPRQLDYFQKVKNSDLVFSIGPAGTGKTFLAVAMALAALKRNDVSKIILSRPAVEAGESLGFLPGDLQEKLDPYIRPLTDALFYMLHPDKLRSYMEKNIIEITPLAYMRGRTLNNSMIILDEAQNATITQMKMFLTRLGANSRAIITGDVTQIDLKDRNQSGLRDAERVLKGIDGIEFVYFSNKDVVRHKLVAKIVEAYENDNNNQQK
jgi:phosphate starvation-inducible protein PhoH and related proteins